MEKERAKKILKHCLKTVKSSALAKYRKATAKDANEGTINLKEGTKYSPPVWLPNS